MPESGAAVRLFASRRKSLNAGISMTIAALQRRNMVESQVRPSDVTDRRVTAAMTAIPREKFVPGHLAAFAYSDENLDVGDGQTMLAPSTLARLVQLADIEAGDSILVIGGSCGYAAAIVAQFAANVVALLPSAKAAADVAQVCSELAIANMTAVHGKLADGWVEKAPFDVIVIEGGVEAVPEPLTAQLAEGGRLVAVEVERGVGHAFLLHKRSQMLARRDAFQATAPLLPGFEAPKPAFVF
jgi:protein-L-isoaspartate(D-aspartate) O-methyltransferase